jgi:hypothetical protein
VPAAALAPKAIAAPDITAIYFNFKLLFLPFHEKNQDL